MFSESGLTHHFRQSSFCGEGYLSSKRSALLEDVSAPTGLHLHSKRVAYIPASAIPTDKAIQQVIFAGGPLQPPGTSSSTGKECTPVDEESTSYTAELRQEWGDSGSVDFLHNDDSSSCTSTGEDFWVGVAASEQVSQMAIMGGLKKDDESIDGDDDTQEQLEILDEDEHVHLQRMYRSRVEDNTAFPLSVDHSRSHSIDNGTNNQEHHAAVQDLTSSRHLEEHSETPVVQFSQEELRSYYSRHLSADEAVSLDLANTLLQWRVPVYAFDDIMKWMQRSAAREGFDPLSQKKSYKSFMEGVRQSMRANKPISVPVRLEWGAKHIDIDGAEKTRFPFRTVDVITFDFRREVENLMAQDFASQSESLVLNPQREDWFRPYKLTPDQAIDEIMTGSCYQNYINNVWAHRPDKHNCYVKGLMLYIDGTPCDGSQRFGLEPLLFTFVDFKRKVRNQPEAWGYLGLIPDIYLSSKAGKTVAGNDPKRSGETSRNFHKILEILLKPVLDVQDTGIPNFPLQIDDLGKIVTLLLPVFLVTADGLEADKISIRKISYRQGCIRICPGCDCSCNDADNVDHVESTGCRFLDQSIIARLCEEALSEDPSKREMQTSAEQELSEKYNMHRCRNAFFPFKHLGGDNHGIFGACPPCFSHVMEHGVYQRAIACFFKLCSSTVLYELDMLAQTMLCKCPRQSSRRRFPRVTFTHGVTNLVKLTCKEMTGLLFTLAIITGTRRCSTLLHRRLKGKQGREDHKLKPDDLKALKEARDAFFSADESVGSRLTKVFSSLLAFQAWTKKKDGFWLAAPDASDKATCRQNDAIRHGASASIRIMQQMVKGTIPRTEGNGWRTQKFHSITHFPVAIDKFGSPRNFDTACMEKNHKICAKGPAFTAQKRVATFLPQSAERICDHLSIRRACRRFGISEVKSFREDEDDDIWGDVEDIDKETDNSIKRAEGTPRNLVTGLKLKLISVRSNPLDQSSSSIIFHDHWWSGSVDKLPRNTKHGRECYLRDAKRPFQIPGPARKYLTSLHRQGGSVYVFTEIKRELAGGGYQTIRCHPDYNQNGPWYDWGDFSFSNGSDNVVQIPCKILALYLKVEYVNGVNVQPGGLLIEDLTVDERDELVEVQTEIQSQGGSSRHTVSLMGEVRAVVHCCEYPRSEEDNDLDTCLMTCWTMEYQHSKNPRKNKRRRDQHQEFDPIIRSVPLATFSRSIFVLEEYPGVYDSKSPTQRNIYQIEEQREWSKEFT